MNAGRRWQALRARVRAAWGLVRRLCDDDAYDQYLLHVQHTHPHDTPLSRRDFERDRQQRKWNRFTRCC